MQGWSAAGRARKKKRLFGLENRSHSIEQLEARLVLAGAPVAPLGSLVFEEQFVDEISSLGQTKSFQLDLDPGQKLSLVVATDEDLVAETEFVGPNGTTLAFDVGTEVTFQTLSIDLGGTYTLTIGGEADSTGSFTIQVWHNAAIEMEQHGGLGNSTVSTAQDMSGSFISLGDGLADRGAVVGGSGSEDDTEEWLSFVLDDGQTATLALAELSGPTGATLELYDETLTRLALGVVSSGADQVIHNFTDLTTDGASAVYFAHIINPPKEFNLVVTRDSDFDADGGKAFSLAEQITPTRSVLGHVKEAVGAALDPLTTFPGPSFGGFIPPDPIHAVGPAQIVAMVNTEIAIYDKAGNRLFRQSTNGTGGFFGSVGATTTVFDPWVTFDPVSQRFFALGIELTSSTKSHLYMAVSTDETPTSGAEWHKYKLDFTHIPDGTGLGAGPHFPDYPKMSVSEDAVFISGNYFAIGTGSGRYVGLTALDKTSLLNGSGATKLYEEYFEGFTVFPLQHYDNSQTQYFAESVGTSTIRIHAITDVLTTPTRVTHDLAVPEFGPPIDVPQLGGGVPADTVSERVMTGVWRNGSAWFAHPITDPAIGDQETVSRWYEVATNNFPTADPTLIQSGNVDPGPGLHAWSPAIAVDAAGNMAIGFSLGGPDQFLGAGYTGRLDSDSLGTTTSPVFEYVSGQANYVLTDGVGRNRWGDYSGMSIDPADDSTFWVFNQYSSSSNKWATRIGSFQLDAIPESDWYQFEVDAGETFAIETFTPFGDAGMPENALDPFLELYAPDGTLLAQDDNSGTDGRNATITHTASAAGAYRVRTYPANGTEGDYVVSVSPPNNTGDPSPTILDTTPDDGQRVDRFPSTIPSDFRNTCWQPQSNRLICT